MNELVSLQNWEKAKYAIEQCRTMDEVKDIRDKAAALAAYAKQARESLDVQNNIAEIKIRAERKIGEFSRELPKEQGGVTRYGSPHDEENQPTKTYILKSAGIEPKTAYRYEAIASIPQDKFEEHIQKTKEEKGELTTAGTLQVAKGNPHVSHNSGENEWYTPPEYIEAARKVMGGIDLDPASSDIANKIVGAKQYFTKTDNGLDKQWAGNVWMNPPYSHPLISQFTSAIADKYSKGEINQACVLVNNATETAWFQELMVVANAVCFIKGRIKYLNELGNVANSPLQGQSVLYMGRNIDEFVVGFTSFGVVLLHER